MDETGKCEMRNYLSAAGFFLIAGYFLLMQFNVFGGSTLVGNASIGIVSGIGLLVLSTLLIILHKRDMIALLFMMMGCLALIFSFIESSSVVLGMTLAGVVLLSGLVMLTSKDNKKWLLFPIPALIFLAVLLNRIFGFGIYISIILGILIVFSFYLAFCCATERVLLPGNKLLTVDEQTDFKASGSALGYLLFAFITGLYANYYIVGNTFLPIQDIVSAELVVAFLMIFIAVLLLVVGKMRFTPVMFILIGLSNLLAMFSEGQMFIGIGILFLIIGLFALLRKESRFLPAIMLILYGCSAFFSVLMGDGGGSDKILSFIHDAIPCLIAVYLSFVVYSQRKLPKF